MHRRHVKMSFAQSILCTVTQEVPLLFLAPTDNNTLFLCSFIKNILLPPSLPTRNTFLQGFFLLLFI